MKKLTHIILAIPEFFWVTFIFFATFLISCNGDKVTETKLKLAEQQIQEFESSQEYRKFKEKKINSVKYESEINISDPASYLINKYTMDDCEYLGFVPPPNSTNQRFFGSYLTHKGNCKFCHARDSIMIRAIVVNVVMNPFNK